MYGFSAEAEPHSSFPPGRSHRTFRRRRICRRSFRTVVSRRSFRTIVSRRSLRTVVFRMSFRTVVFRMASSGLPAARLISSRSPSGSFFRIRAVPHVFSFPPARAVPCSAAHRTPSPFHAGMKLSFAVPPSCMNPFFTPICIA